ncbi:hypothetical protein J31TS4_22730 [Paenibacillus sp. J31TS4]|uniref:FIMAH domain-containing protein n=1 Tax=Paenibacillus sp. J31TS4 TaxID=2807195 RepID=UPI001AFF9397|nr:hypothetical protein [Paenibacillus sp. J31TS4]GIP38993.1 hypothetical protein J31TS4_22730 [Paenibacillus sp. J31TS4]
MIKRLFALVLAASLCLGLLPAFSSVALAAECLSPALANPGFEEPVAGTKIPNWSYFGPANTAGNIVQVTQETKLTGISSLKIDKSSTTNSLGVTSDRFAVTPGCTYTASSNVYLEAGGTIMYLRFYDSAGKQIAGADVTASLTSPLNKWTPLIAEGIAPAAAVKAEILLYVSVASKSKLYYDDVSVQVKKTFQLPFEFGAPVKMGPATVTSNTGAAAVGDGEIYVTPSGSPAMFYALDALTGEVRFEQALPGLDVVWAMTMGSDGNVYFAGTQNSILYRYLPKEKRIENLGANPSNKWVWDLDASSDGKLFGSTYPDSKAFLYDIASGTFQDLGTIYPGQDYVRGGGVSDRYYYAGTGTVAHLIRIDRSTLKMEEIQTPATGTETFISNIWTYNGLLFMAYGTSLAIMDEQNPDDVKKVMRWTDAATFDGMISSPSPFQPDLIYFRNKNTSELWTYNTSKNEIKPVEPGIKVDNAVKSYKWMKVTSGEKAGRTVLAIVQSPVSYSIYDPADQSIVNVRLSVSKQGTNVQSLEKGPDGKIYMGGYQAGMSIYDPETASFERQELQPAQIEGIGVMNGKVYFGIYGGAVIYRYDPSLPYHPKTNPVLFHDIDDGQSRPFAFTSAGSKLFIGTIADYGQLGGALTVYDEQAGTWSVYRDIVKDQSVIGLAHKDGKLYGGTTIYGGLGIDPAASEAKMFEFDVAQGKKTEEFALKVPGVQTPIMIGSLSIGPDGLLWGIVYGKDAAGNNAYALFAMDPAAKTIVKSKLFKNGATGSTWRPYYMKWSDDGILYTTIGRYLVAFDPETLDYKQLVNGYVNLFTLADDGSIYYSTANDAYLVHLPVPLKEAALEADTSLRVGGKAPVTVTGKLVNGKSAILAGASISYSSSNPDVITVENGTMMAVKPGTAELSAQVTLNGVTVQTNKVTVAVSAALGQVTLSADRYDLKRTETVTLSVYGKLGTGEAADLSGASIEYLSSSPAVISPQGVTSAVYETGTADVWVKVTLDGVTVESNKITIRVTTDPEWLTGLIGTYEAAGELGHPLAAQLTNRLRQAEHFREQGRYDQGIKHLEDFLKSLHNPALSGTISQPAKQALDADVQALIAMWKSTERP